MILVVDDDEALRWAICRVLRAAGYPVEAAANGGHALSRLQEATAALLITDIMMPDGDGIELITAAKRDKLALRILAISGRGSLGNLELLKLASMLGADATLVKPFSNEQLLEHVADLMAAEPGGGAA